MRIALVAPRYGSPGGVETHVAEVARHLAARGNEVEVLAQAVGRGRSTVEVVDGVTVRLFPVPVPSQNYAFAPGLWAFLARQRARYDVVHAHHYHCLPALGAALTGCEPLIFTPHYHGTGHSRLRRLLHVPYRHLGGTIFARASRVICNSEAEAALVRRHFRGIGSRIRVVYPGVDIEALRAAEPLHDDRTIILSVGRLEEYKNVHLVVEALAHLNSTFALRVIGDGPVRAALEALAMRLGLQDRVEFLGRVDTALLRRWFRTASVCVSMSGREAFGLTVAEALAAGAGVVATDIPAHREVVAGASSDAVSLLPLDTDPKALAEAVRAAAIRPREVLDAPNVASWDTVAAQTLQVYRYATCRTQ